MSPLMTCLRFLRRDCSDADRYETMASKAVPRVWSEYAAGRWVSSRACRLNSEATLFRRSEHDGTGVVLQLNHPLIPDLLQVGLVRSRPPRRSDVNRIPDAEYLSS